MVTLGTTARWSLLAALALSSGCIERKERLTIRGDGTVEFVHTVRGGPSEFREDGADALPGLGGTRDLRKVLDRSMEPASPWKVAISTENKGTKDEKLVYEARATFAEDKIPESFGAADDPAPLRWKTSIAQVAGEHGARRFVFERRYEPRAYAWRERLHRRAFPEELERALEGSGERKPSPEVMKRAAEAALRFEREKAATLLDEAMTAASPEPPGVAQRLVARVALERALAASFSPEMVLDSLEKSKEEQKALEARFREETLRAAARAGATALAPEKDRPAIERRVGEAFERSRRVLDATEELELESFEVRVEFPVPVILTDEGSIDEGGKSVVFRFSGKDMNDHAVVLRAVAEGR